MASHFHLLSKARKFSPIKMAQLSDSEARALLCQIRWGVRKMSCVQSAVCSILLIALPVAINGGVNIATIPLALHQGTIFADRKLSIQTYLYAIALFVNAAKGLSACQLSRDLNVQYKTAFTLAHKIRESLQIQKQLFPLSGEIHIDGTYVHSASRPKNKKNERVDRRLKENANPNKRSILVMRSRYSEEETAENPYLVGAKKTLTFPILSENSQVVNKLATNYIKAGSRIHADENSAYDELMIHYDLRRVNHQKEYRSDEGITNNLAESYFSRFKRMIIGTHHKISNKYLDNYANECAYREDNRGVDNLSLFNSTLGQCLATNNTTDWQGNHRQAERLIM